MKEFWSNIRVFVLGFLEACLGGLEPVITLVVFSLINYQDYGIDWRLVGTMALTGSAKQGLAYYQKHKALLQLPLAYRLKLEQAEQATAELHDARATTANLKAVAQSVAQGDLSPGMLTRAVLAAPAPNPHIATSADEVQDGA